MMIVFLSIEKGRGKGSYIDQTISHVTTESQHQVLTLPTVTAGQLSASPLVEKMTPHGENSNVTPRSAIGSPPPSMSHLIENIFRYRTAGPPCVEAGREKSAHDVINPSIVAAPKQNWARCRRAIHIHTPLPCSVRRSLAPNRCP
jgi:hypothetical protein